MNSGLRLYVAGKDPELARGVMDHFRNQGYIILLDWTSYGRGIREEFVARMMVMAVHECDVLVLCRPEPGMLGAYLETGMAMAFGRPVIVYGAGEEPKDSLFWTLPRVKIAPDLTTLEKQLLKEKRR